MLDQFDMTLLLTALLIALLTPVLDASLAAFMALMILAAFIVHRAHSGRPNNPRG